MTNSATETAPMAMFALRIVAPGTTIAEMRRKVIPISIISGLKSLM